MKSLFVGLITLTTTLLLVAQIPNKERVLQSDASVSLSVNISTNYTLAAQNSSQVASQSAQYAQANASLAQISAANSSYWADGLQGYQTSLAQKVTALMALQASISINIAGQFQAKLYALIYDPINVLAGATSLLQTATVTMTLNSAALTQAQTLVAASALQLAKQLAVLSAQSLSQVFNATAIKIAATAALNANTNPTTQSALVIANNAVSFSTSQSQQIVAASLQAQECSSAASSATNSQVSSSATFSCQQVAQKISQIGSMNNQILAAFQYDINLSNVAYADYAKYLLQMQSALNSSSYAGSLANNASIACQVASIAAAANSLIVVNNAGSAVYYSVNAVISASQRAQLSKNRCSAASLSLVLQTKIQKLQCKAIANSVSSGAQAQGIVSCNNATLLVKLASQAKTQACAQ